MFIFFILSESIKKIKIMKNIYLKSEQNRNLKKNIALSHLVFC